MGKKAIKRYTTPSGLKRWVVNQYWGINPDTGKQVYARKQGFLTKRDATKWRDEEMQRLNDTMGSSGFKKITMTQLSQQYLAMYKESGVMPNTYNGVRILVNKYIIPTIGDVYVHRLKTSHCQRCVDYTARHRKDYRKVGALLYNILKTAVHDDIINKNPAEFITYRNANNRQSSSSDRTRNYYTRDEMRTVLDIMKVNLYHNRWAFFATLYYTGMRKGELLAINRDDIDVDNHRITINKTVIRDYNHRQTISSGTKTSNANPNQITQIPIVKALREILYPYLDVARSEEGFLFSDAKAKKPTLMDTTNYWLTAFYDKNADTLKDNGINHRITVHGFRHSTASALFSMGVDIKSVQTLLRHSNIKTTMDIYTHVTTDNLADTLDDILNL